MANKQMIYLQRFAFFWNKVAEVAELFTGNRREADGKDPGDNFIAGGSGQRPLVQKVVITVKICVGTDVEVKS